jgi:hypothetical protein
VPHPPAPRSGGPGARPGPCVRDTTPLPRFLTKQVAMRRNDGAPATADLPMGKYPTEIRRNAGSQVPDRVRTIAVVARIVIDHPGVCRLPILLQTRGCGRSLGTSLSACVPRLRFVCIGNPQA